MDFNYIISLGGDCTIGEVLRNLKYKDYSYPFDWSVSKKEKIYKSFNNNFYNFFSYDNLCPASNGKTKEKDDSIYYYHDYLFNELKTKKLEITKQKYERRCNRLLSLLNSDNTILFIRKAEKDTINDMKKLKNIIKNKYNSNFNILLINNIEENSDDESIIHLFLEKNFFLYLKNDIYGYRIDRLQVIDRIQIYIKKLIKKSKIFPQPKYRDNINN